MSVKTPIRTVFDASNNATGLAEFQSGEFIGLTHGGLGASLSIGSAGQILKVNTGGSALEFGNVEAVVNIDGATDLTSATLVAGDQILLSDGGTEGRVTLSQIDTLFTDTTQTLTNKSISGSSNTLSNIANGSLSNSSITFGDGSNSTAASLGGSVVIQGTSNEVEVAESSGTFTVGLPNNVTIAGNATVTGNLTVNGSTTTVSSTNTTIADNLLELNSGATSNANDTGILIERGSTGDNAIIAWDESADKFVVGTTTATASSTGNLTITSATLVANTFEGALTGNVTGNLTGNVTGNVTGDLTGDVTGNADTATALATARNIAGQSFDGTGNITIASTDLSDTSSIALLTATQTMTNKTLTSPKINEDVAVTATATELNFVDGVTSAIQTQLDTKAAKSFAIAQSIALG